MSNLNTKGMQMLSSNDDESIASDSIPRWTLLKNPSDEQLAQHYSQLATSSLATTVRDIKPCPYNTEVIGGIPCPYACGLVAKTVYELNQHLAKSKSHKSEYKLQRKPKPPIYLTFDGVFTSVEQCGMCIGMVEVHDYQHFQRNEHIPFECHHGRGEFDNVEIDGGISCPYNCGLIFKTIGELNEHMRAFTNGNLSSKLNQSQKFR